MEWGVGRPSWGRAGAGTTVPTGPTASVRSQKRPGLRAPCPLPLGELEVDPGGSHPPPGSILDRSGQTTLQRESHTSVLTSHLLEFLWSCILPDGV